MPHIQTTFSPSPLLAPAWIQTVAPALLRKFVPQKKVVETLNLPDGDFLDLAWYPPSTKDDRLEMPHHGIVVLTHGLEGSFDSGYIIGLARIFSSAGYLVVAWNMRGCGNKPNRLPSWYHSGQSKDLTYVLEHIHSRYPAHALFCIGISIGGNILCKYLGEQAQVASKRIRAAVAVSTPLDLRGSAETLAKPSRRLYMEYLLRPLRARIREKARCFPHLFSTSGLNSIATFHEFDARYTAPLHGFTSIDHYWDTCSGMQYLAHINTPLLLLAANDDPFLSRSCFPDETVQSSPYIHVEIPEHGGHVGFITSLSMHTTWLEHRILDFIETQRALSEESFQAGVQS